MDTDGQYGLLSKHERRVIIREVVDSEGPTTMESLVTAIVTHVSDHDERSARLRLHHVDLPKLDEVGVLEYDSRTGDVMLNEDCDDLAKYLDVADEEILEVVV